MSFLLRVIYSVGLCGSVLFGQTVTGGAASQQQAATAAGGTAETDFLEEGATRAIPTGLDRYLDTSSGALLPENAVNFFEAFLPQDATCTSGDGNCVYAVRNFAGLYKKGTRNDKAIHTGTFLIHVAIWGPTTASSATPAVKDDRWYVYHKGKLFTSKQLYGAKRFWFIYVHLNVTGAYRSRYDFKIVQATSAALQHLYALAALLTAGASPAAPVKPPGNAPAPALPPNVWGGKEINTEFGTSDVTIASTFTLRSANSSAALLQPTASHSPAMTANLNPPTPRGALVAVLEPPEINPSALSLRPAAALTPAALARSVLPLDVAPELAAVPAAAEPAQDQPSQPAAPPGSNAANTLDSPQSFHSEAPSWWDVSIGFPVTAVNQLTFNSSSSGLVPQQIDKRRLFGLLDFYWLPYQRMEIAKNGFSWVPSFVAGLPLASQPLHRPLFALGWGPPLIQVYAGAILAKQATVPSGAAVVGKPCTGWCPQFSFGVNISMKAVQDKLNTSKQK